MKKTNILSGIIAATIIASNASAALINERTEITPYIIDKVAEGNMAVTIKDPFSPADIFLLHGTPAIEDMDIKLRGNKKAHERYSVSAKTPEGLPDSQNYILIGQQDVYRNLTEEFSVINPAFNAWRSIGQQYNIPDHIQEYMNEKGGDFARQLLSENIVDIFAILMSIKHFDLPKEDALLMIDNHISNQVFYTNNMEGFDKYKYLTAPSLEIVKYLINHNSISTKHLDIETSLAIATNIAFTYVTTDFTGYASGRYKELVPHEIAMYLNARTDKFRCRWKCDAMVIPENKNISGSHYYPELRKILLSYSTDVEYIKSLNDDDYAKYKKDVLDRLEGSKGMVDYDKGYYAYDLHFYNQLEKDINSQSESYLRLMETFLSQVNLSISKDWAHSNFSRGFEYVDRKEHIEQGVYSTTDFMIFAPEIGEVPMWKPSLLSPSDLYK